MVEVTEKDWDISVPNYQTRGAENLFFKSAWFTDFHYRKPIVSNMINLNQMSLIVGDATDDDTVTNVSFMIGKIGRSNATLIPRILSSIKNPPVLKFADADPGNRNAPHQNGGDNQNNANGNGVAIPNAWPMELLPITAHAGNLHMRHGGNDGEDGNGNGGNDDGGNGNNGNGVKLKILRMNLFQTGRVLKQIILTNSSANQFNSWRHIGKAIHQYWAERICTHENQRAVEMEDVNTFNIWPGCITGFVRLERARYIPYRMYEQPWETVKTAITHVMVYQPILRPMPFQNGDAVILLGGAAAAYTAMLEHFPLQAHGGNGNGNGGNGHGGNGNEIGAADDENGNGNGGDDGGHGNGNGGDDGGHGNGYGGDDGGNGNGNGGDDGGHGNGNGGDDGGNGGGDGENGSEGHLV